MTEHSHNRLVINLDACERCYEFEGCCAVGCGGLTSVREVATFHTVCRRCEHASCIVACPFGALERQQDGGVIKRHNLRCVSCTLCAQACPFGTIYPEMLPFYAVQCTGCNGAEEKKCVTTCRQGTMEYRQVGPDEEGVHIVDQYLAVKAGKWLKREPGAEVTA